MAARRICSSIAATCRAAVRSVIRPRRAASRIAALRAESTAGNATCACESSPDRRSLRSASMMSRWYSAQRSAWSWRESRPLASRLSSSAWARRAPMRIARHSSASSSSPPPATPSQVRNARNGSACVTSVIERDAEDDRHQPLAIRDVRGQREHGGHRQRALDVAEHHHVLPAPRDAFAGEVQRAEDAVDGHGAADVQRDHGERDRPGFAQQQLGAQLDADQQEQPDVGARTRRSPRTPAARARGSARAGPASRARSARRRRRRRSPASRGSAR